MAVVILCYGMQLQSSAFCSKFVKHIVSGTNCFPMQAHCQPVGATPALFPPYLHLTYTTCLLPAHYQMLGEAAEDP